MSESTHTAPELGQLSRDQVYDFIDEWYLNDDDDAYEKACEELGKENEAYLGEFEADLTVSGLKESTIDKHIGNVGFFLDTFLLRSAPVDMRMGCYLIDDYLGDFFIRKCLWSTPNAIKENVAGFKKFYKSMLGRGHILQEDYDEVLATIKQNKGEWCERCYEFNHPQADDLYPLFGAGMEHPHLPELLEGNDVANALFASLMQEFDELGLPEDDVISRLQHASNELEEQMALFDASDEELLELLEGVGIRLTRDALKELVPRYASEGELVNDLEQEQGANLDEDGYEFALMICGLLWERWCPNDPSEVTFLANVQAGYDCYMDERDEMLELWGTAWEALKRNMRVRGAEKLADYHGCFDMHPTLDEWVGTYEAELSEAALESEEHERTHAALKQDLDKML